MAGFSNSDYNFGSESEAMVTDHEKENRKPSASSAGNGLKRKAMSLDTRDNSEISSKKSKVKKTDLTGVNAFIAMARTDPHKAARQLMEMEGVTKELKKVKETMINLLREVKDMKGNTGTNGGPLAYPPSPPAPELDVEKAEQYWDRSSYKDAVEDLKKKKKSTIIEGDPAEKDKDGLGWMHFLVDEDGTAVSSEEGEAIREATRDYFIGLYYDKSCSDFEITTQTWTNIPLHHKITLCHILEGSFPCVARCSLHWKAHEVMSRTYNNWRIKFMPAVGLVNASSHTRTNPVIPVTPHPHLSGIKSEAPQLPTPPTAEVLRSLDDPSLISFNDSSPVLTRGDMPPPPPKVQLPVLGGQSGVRFATNNALAGMHIQMPVFKLPTPVPAAGPAPVLATTITTTTTSTPAPEVHTVPTTVDNIELLADAALSNINTSVENPPDLDANIDPFLEANAAKASAIAASGSEYQLASLQLLPSMLVQPEPLLPVATTDGNDMAVSTVVSTGAAIDATFVLASNHHNFDTNQVAPLTIHHPIPQASAGSFMAMQAPAALPSISGLALAGPGVASGPPTPQPGQPGTAQPRGGAIYQTRKPMNARNLYGYLWKAQKANANKTTNDFKYDYENVLTEAQRKHWDTVAAYKLASEGMVSIDKDLAGKLRRNDAIPVVVPATATEPSKIIHVQYQ